MRISDNAELAGIVLEAVSYTHLDVYKRQVEEKTEKLEFVRG